MQEWVRYLMQEWVRYFMQELVRYLMQELVRYHMQEWVSHAGIGEVSHAGIGMGEVFHAGMGEVSHAGMGEVYHAGMGYVSPHTGMGKVSHAGMGEVFHAGMGEVFHAGMGKVSQAAMGMGKVSHAAMGEVSHAAMGEVSQAQMVISCRNWAAQGWGINRVTANGDTVRKSYLWNKTNLVVNKTVVSTLLKCPRYSSVHVTQVSTLLKCPRYSSVHVTQVSTLLNCPRKSIVHVTHVSTLLKCPRYLSIHVTHVSTLHNCPRYSSVHVTQVSTLLMCPRYTIVQVTQLSTLLRCPRYSSVHVTQLSTLLKCPRSHSVKAIHKSETKGEKKMRPTIMKDLNGRSCSGSEISRATQVSDVQLVSMRYIPCPHHDAYSDHNNDDCLASTAQNKSTEPMDSFEGSNNFFNTDSACRCVDTYFMDEISDCSSDVLSNISLRGRRAHCGPTNLTRSLSCLSRKHPHISHTHSLPHLTHTTPPDSGVCSESTSSSLAGIPAINSISDCDSYCHSVEDDSDSNTILNALQPDFFDSTPEQPREIQTENYQKDSINNEERLSCETDTSLPSVNMGARNHKLTSNAEVSSECCKSKSGTDELLLKVVEQLGSRQLCVQKSGLSPASGDGDQNKGSEKNETNRKYKKLKYRKDIPKESFCSKYTSCRWVLAYMCFMGRFVQTALRQCMGVAVLGMTMKRTVTVQEIGNATVDSAQLSNWSEAYNDTGLLINRTYTEQEMTWDSVFEGVLLASFNAGSVITPIIVGYLTTRHGGRNLMMLCLLCAGVFTVLLPISARAHTSLIIIMRVFTGIALSGSDTLIQAMWAKWAPVYELASLSSCSYTGLSVAGVLTFLICGYLVSIGGDGRGWPYIFYLFGSLSLLLAPIWWLSVYDLPESHPRITKKELAIITFNKQPEIFDDKQDGLLSSLPFVGRIISGLITGYLSDWLLRRGLSVCKTRKLFQGIGCFGCAMFSLFNAFIPTLTTGWSITLLVLALSFQNATSVAFRINLLDIAP
ncbi:hypothetical protein Btru_027296, partial [Bulinus truncatus]